MNNPMTKADSVNTPRFILRNTRRLWLCLLLGIVVVPLAWVNSSGRERHHATKLRWDLINLSTDTPPVLSEGGVDWAKAADGSQITLTGSGTFLSVHGQGEPHAVTGGGTWETLDSS